MALAVNERYQIVMDKYNYILQKKYVRTDKNTGEQVITWSNVGYYGSLAILCKNFLDKNIKTAVNWEDVVSKIDIAMSDIERLYSGLKPGPDVVNKEDVPTNEDTDDDFLDGLLDD